MASPGNRHCANCIGTLYVPYAMRGRCRWLQLSHEMTDGAQAAAIMDVRHATCNLTEYRPIDTTTSSHPSADAVAVAYLLHEDEICSPFPPHPRDYTPIPINCVHIPVPIPDFTLFDFYLLFKQLQ